MVVVFLNCFLRSPGWLFHDNQSDRIPLIPIYTIVDKNAICGLCEVFGATYNKKLELEYKKYGHKYVSCLDVSSGLALAYPKKYKLVNNFFEKYTDSKLPDSLANKGIMHCVLKCDNQNPINILLTHLQCPYTEDNISLKKFYRYREIQLAQLNQLQNYIRRNKLQNYILMGDFNINKNVNDPLFMELLRLFGYKSKISSLPSYPTFPETNEIIDYIFIKNVKPGKTVVLGDRANIILQKNQNEKFKNPKHRDVSTISDHYAICLSMV
jgi:endonuclease/exonuclease/phosphatase family metal-dependent hydrolase